MVTSVGKYLVKYRITHIFAEEPLSDRYTLAYVGKLLPQLHALRMIRRPRDFIECDGTTIAKTVKVLVTGKVRFGGNHQRQLGRVFTFFRRWNKLVGKVRSRGHDGERPGVSVAE